MQVQGTGILGMQKTNQHKLYTTKFLGTTSGICYICNTIMLRPIN